MLLVLILVATGCGSSDAGSGTPPAARTQTAAAGLTPAGTPTEAPPDLTVFRGFIMPVAGGCLPQSDNLMPNAPREYRSGVHEGVDFYEADNCTDIGLQTPVLAAKDGVISRIDTIYHDLTQAELDEANTRIANGEPNAFEVLDLFRGRQVWIDHGKGIITRYAHLEFVAPDLAVGDSVTAGQTVGFVGDSGTPESLSAPNTELHLHWEFRAGEGFLGEGLPPADVRATYERLFEPAP